MSESKMLTPELDPPNGATSERLLPVVYDELRKLASQRLALENPGQTLQPTALVHEAWLRLVKSGKSVFWDSEGHFFSAAAEAMRRILIDRARQKQAKKRSAHRIDAAWGEFVVPLSESGLDELLDLDDAISRLEEIDPDSAELVKLRVFAGLSVEEAAVNLRVSPRKAYRTWAFAKAWLYRDLEGGDS